VTTEAVARETVRRFGLSIDVEQNTWITSRQTVHVCWPRSAAVCSIGETRPSEALCGSPRLWSGVVHTMADNTAIDCALCLERLAVLEAARDAPIQVVGTSSGRVPSTTLASLLDLERALNRLEAANLDALAERVRDAMDPLWYALTQVDRDWLNARDMPSQ
jgi:hypothetical protein